MNFEYGEWKSEFKHRRKASHNPSDHDVSRSSSDLHETNIPPKRTKEKAASSAVRPRRKDHHTGQGAIWFMAVVGVAGALSLLHIVTHEVSPEQRQRRSDKRAIVQWRRSVQSRCQRFLNTVGDDWSTLATQRNKERIDLWAFGKFQLPEGTGPRDNDYDSPSPLGLSEEISCTHAFIDLGSGKGDALGAWIELALDVCTPLWHNQHHNLAWMHPWFSRPRFNVETLQLATNSSSDGSPEKSSYLPASSIRRFLHSWLWRIDTKLSRLHLPSPVFPEDMCILGMEDNHRRKAELRRLETFVAGIQPPIFRSFHMISGTSTDTTEDVQLPKKMDGQTVGSSDVVPRRLKQIMVPLLPMSSMQSGTGGLLMIRVDLNTIAGLEEAVMIQVLCDLLRLGTSVVVLLDSRDAVSKHQDQSITALEECGTVFINLDEYWKF